MLDFLFPRPVPPPAEAAVPARPAAERPDGAAAAEAALLTFQNRLVARRLHAARAGAVIAATIPHQQRTEAGDEQG